MSVRGHCRSRGERQKGTDRALVGGGEGMMSDSSLPHLGMTNYWSPIAEEVEM